MVRRKFRNVQRRDRRAEKKKQRTLIISVFFVFLMVVSILGVYISYQENNRLTEFRYNDFEFEIQDIGFGQTALVTEVNGEEIPFYSLPQDTGIIRTTGNVTQELGTSGYVVLAANVSPQALELIDLMRFDFDRYANVLAVNAPYASNITLDGVSCANATPQVPIILINETFSDSQITAENNCVDIQVTANDMFLIRDRLLFSFTGVMQR